MMYNKLRDIDRLPMHMPGHKRNISLSPYLAGLGADMDITEIHGYDNLHDPEEMIADCMNRAAALWGSRKAHLLINGSTCGILAAVRTLTRRGDKVLMTRGAHKSVFHAVELCGLEPVFFLPPVLDELDIFGSASAEDIDSLLCEHPDVKLVIITSPTYEGVISDISGICNAAHRRNIPVMVDEAHGAHLGLAGVFPAGAVASGADIVIHSLHKTLPSLTQTAMLHICSDRVDTERLSHQLAVFETSSPSYLLMASIDGCVRLLETGNGLLTGWSTILSGFDKMIKPLERLCIIGHGYNISCYDFDKSKIPIYTGYSDINGYELADILRNKYNIEPEYAAPRMVLCMTGLGDTADAISRLADALLEIDLHCGCGSPDKQQPVSALMSHTELVIHPEKALEASAELMPLTQAVGRICGEYIWAYPPGIPLLIPGERIPEQLCELISSGKSPELHSTSGKIHAYIRALS